MIFPSDATVTFFRVNNIVVWFRPTGLLSFHLIILYDSVGRDCRVLFMS